MKKVTIIIFIALTGMLCAWSCNKQTHSIDKDGHMITLPAGGQDVITGHNAFAFDFFKTTLETDPEPNNKLVSPLSIYLALSMVYNGADHATRDSIKKVLRLSGTSIETLNKVCATILSEFPKSDGAVKLDIANSIWYRNNSLQPLSSFLKILQTDYHASIKALDFNNQTSVDIINHWVADKTQHKIEKVIENISPNDLMYLVNAIYFNGQWQQEFKKDHTEEGDFHLADGRTVRVPFMNAEMKLKTYDASDYTIAELPYGKGGGFAMVILKPKENDIDLRSIWAGLHTRELKEAMLGMKDQTLNISMPRWEYAYEMKDMKPQLSRLGMGIAFNLGADFTRMYDAEPGVVRISKAIHKTYIKVDEKGTEAAAVTGIGMALTAYNPKPTLKLDHPFIYMIIEKQTGSVIFLGTVNDPSKS